MRAFLADLAAKSSQDGALGAFGRRFLARQNVLRYGIAPAAVAIAYTGPNTQTSPRSNSSSVTMS